MKQNSDDQNSASYLSTQDVPVSQPFGQTDDQPQDGRWADDSRAPDRVDQTVSRS